MSEIRTELRACLLRCLCLTSKLHRHRVEGTLKSKEAMRIRDRLVQKMLNGFVKPYDFDASAIGQWLCLVTQRGNLLCEDHCVRRWCGKVRPACGQDHGDVVEVIDKAVAAMASAIEADSGVAGGEGDE